MINLPTLGKLNNAFYKALSAIIISSTLLITGCGSGSDSTSTQTTSSTNTEVTSDADFEVTDWTTETHSKKVAPNFSEVFDDTQVKRLDFVITKTRWQSMLNNMTSIYGTFGTPVAGNGLLDNAADPDYVPADVY